MLEAATNQEILLLNFFIIEKERGWAKKIPITSPLLEKEGGKAKIS